MVFCFVQNFFSGQHELEYYFPQFNIRLYDKNSESEYFLFLHQIQNIFSATLGIRIFFLEKNITKFHVVESCQFSQIFV